MAWAVEGSSSENGYAFETAQRRKISGANSTSYAVAQMCKWPTRVANSVSVNNTAGGVTSTNATLTVVTVSPTNNANCALLNSNATLQTWAIPGSTNPAVTNLEIAATPNPALAPNQFPQGWSLNGVYTNIIHLGLTNPAVYTVVCRLRRFGRDEHH